MLAAIKRQQGAAQIAIDRGSSENRSQRLAPGESAQKAFVSRAPAEGPQRIGFR
jgi:hypothetical protein